MVRTRPGRIAIGRRSWQRRAPAQTGFTLIELMITVAIVGILASIALGQWRDYTRRARMSEVVLALGNCKTRVAESYLSLPTPPYASADFE